MNKIEKSFKKINDIPELNYGGCLIAAYSVYRKVINNPNVRVVQLSKYSNDFEISHNKEFIAGKESKPMPGYHFGITINNGETIYDSNGIYTNHVNFYIIPRHKTHEFCKKAILGPYWNNSFNRRHVPEILKKLKITIKFLNRYGKQK